MSKIDQHLAICKPVNPDNQLLQSMALPYQDLFEYQGFVAAKERERLIMACFLKCGIQNGIVQHV